MNYSLCMPRCKDSTTFSSRLPTWRVIPRNHVGWKAREIFGKTRVRAFIFVLWLVNEEVNSPQLWHLNLRYLWEMSVLFICSIKHLSTFIKWTPNSVHGGQRFFDGELSILQPLRSHARSHVPGTVNLFLKKSLEHTVPYFFKIWFIFDKT